MPHVDDDPDTDPEDLLVLGGKKKSTKLMMENTYTQFIDYIRTVKRSNERIEDIPPASLEKYHSDYFWQMKIIPKVSFILFR